MSTPNKKVIFGILGAAIGATIYVLLAPGKSEWKQKFSDTVSDIASRVGEYFTSAKDKLNTA